jgi:hypothetical protein
MQIINQKLSAIDHQAVLVNGKPYTLYVDSAANGQAHILFMDSNEECQGEIQAFIKEVNAYTKDWECIITGCYDMFVYDGPDDTIQITAQQIKKITKDQLKRLETA